MRRNAHKKETFEDKFARHYYCEHARLNSIRADKKEQHKNSVEILRNLLTYS